MQKDKQCIFWAKLVLNLRSGNVCQRSEKRSAGFTKFWQRWKIGNIGNTSNIRNCFWFNFDNTLIFYFHPRQFSSWFYVQMSFPKYYFKDDKSFVKILKIPSLCVRQWVNNISISISGFRPLETLYSNREMKSRIRLVYQICINQFNQCIGTSNRVGLHWPLSFPSSLNWGRR